MLLKYHAEEERWQNLICSDLKHYATHFWLFVCVQSTVQNSYHTIYWYTEARHRERKNVSAGREIAPNTGANATKFFTLTTKSWHFWQFSLQTEPLSQGYYLKHTTGYKTVSWTVNTWSKADYINILMSKYLES